MSNAISLVSPISKSLELAIAAELSDGLGGGAGIGIAIGLIVLIMRGSALAVVMGRELAEVEGEA